MIQRSRNLLLIVSIFTLHATANEAPNTPLDKPKSFSYFAIGSENINYKESINIGGAHFKTDTSATNSVLLSGARTFISREMSFSINAISTLFPNHVDETWRLTNTIVGPADLDGDGSADPGATQVYEPQIVQTNRFTYSRVSTQFLMHYHPDLWWSIDAGATYSLGTFKRFSFNYNDVLVCDTAQRDCSGNTVVEETFGEFSIQAGGSIHVPIAQDFLWRFSALVGMPLFSRIENSLYPELDFDSTSGWHTEIISSLVYKISENVSFGVVYDFQYHYKDQQNQTSNQLAVYIPENERIAQRAGLVGSWSF